MADAGTGLYSLPAGHAAWLTRAAGMNNMASGMQYIGLLALVSVESHRVDGDIVDAYLVATKAP